MKHLVLCMLLLALSAAVTLAAPAPMDILTRAMSVQRGVRDYIAKVAVDTDIPDVDIPHRTATVYVKPPDKTYVDSGGSFVVIPKRALLFGDVAKDIQKEANVVLAGSKVQGNQTIYCVKIVPKQNPAPSGRSGFAAPRVMIWVNGNRWTMERIQVVSGSTVMASVDFSYQPVQRIWMPFRVACTIPKGAMGSNKQGHVAISFSDYKLNTGLTDEFFAKKAREQGARSSRSYHRHRHQ